MAKYQDLVDGLIYVFLSPLSGIVRVACVCSFMGLLISEFGERQTVFSQGMFVLSYADNLLNC